MASRLVLLSLASVAMRRTVVSSFAVRARVPVSHFSALRMPVRVMASASDDPLAKVQSAIGSDKVVIFSKSWCPFCLKTKALFDQLGTSYTAVELDEMDDGAAIQDALLGTLLC